METRVGKEQAISYPMTTRSGQSFRGRYNDKERDEIIHLILRRVDLLEAKLFEMNFSGSQHQENPESSSARELDLVSKTNGKETEDTGRKEAACKQPVWGNQSLERPQASLLEMANEIVQSGRQRSQEPYNMAGDITKKVRIDIPDFDGRIDPKFDFDGRIDPKFFSDWLATLERYFDWYDMTDERKVKFAIMKLVGQAQVWWTGVEYDLQLAGEFDLTWEEMKLRLKKKYLPRHYQSDLFDDLTSLRQGGMTVIEYMSRFEELKSRMLSLLRLG